MPDIWGIASIIAKFSLYVGITGATGLVMVRLAFGDLLATLETRLKAYTLILAVVALVAALLSFMLRGAALTGDIGGMIDTEMLGLLWTTPVGDVLVFRMGGVVLLIAGLFMPVVGKWVALVGGTLALWSFAQIGHIPEVEQTGVRLLLLLHLLGISFWIGALAPLRRLSSAPEHLEAAASFGHRFGVAASLIVAALLLAGGLMVWLILGDLSAIFASAYGVTLVAKVALVALLLGFATANKLRFVPAMHSGDQDAAKHLVRSIELEAIVFAAILVATATLTSVLTLPN